MRKKNNIYSVSDTKKKNTLANQIRKGLKENDQIKIRCRDQKLWGMPLKEDARFHRAERAKNWFSIIGWKDQFDEKGRRRLF